MLTQGDHVALLRQKLIGAWAFIPCCASEMPVLAWHLVALRERDVLRNGQEVTATPTDSFPCHI